MPRSWKGDRAYKISISSFLAIFINSWRTPTSFEDGVSINDDDVFGFVGRFGSVKDLLIGDTEPIGSAERSHFLQIYNQMMLLLSEQRQDQEFLGVWKPVRVEQLHALQVLQVMDF